MPTSTSSNGMHRLETQLAAFAGRIAALLGWRRAAAGLAAGAVSVLAMPPFFLWPVLLVTLPVLVWLVDGAAGPAASAGRRRWLARPLVRAALAGWCFGYAFHVLGLYWLREAFLVTGGGLALLWPLGVLGLPAYLALYHGAAAAFAFAVARPGPGRVVALAVGLGASEWLRGHLLTGFPWNVLGIALTYPDTLMQASGLIGIYGLTVVAVLMLATPGVTLARMPEGAERGRWLLGASAALVLPLAGLLAYGTLRLQAPSPGWVEGVRVRLVQPSIPQREKWMADKQPEFIEKHIAITLRDSTGHKDDLAGITHVIWPEAAMPFLPLQRPQVLARLGEALPDGVHLVAGVLRMERFRHPGPEGEEDARVFNSLAVFNAEGEPIHVYDKTHLVPFGEYLPFQDLLEGIGLTALTRQRGGFAIGPNPRPLLAVPGLPGAGPLICYEAVFPGIATRSRERPHVLINATNDGWFGNSTGPRQHLHQARLRAVEEGVALLRVANNGITAAYDPFGRELGRIGMDVAGVLDTHIPRRLSPPPYARFGDLIFLLLSATLLSILYISNSRVKP